MSWTEKEWSTFCVLLDDAWPGEFTERQFSSYRALLEPVEPAQAGEALIRLLHSGQRFRPSVAELLSAIRSDPSQPTFAEAWVLIKRALKAGHVRGTFSSTAAMHRAEDKASLLLLAGSHPLVSSFAERQGVRRLKGIPFDDATWGEKHRRDLEQAWDQHVEAFEGREVASLASGEGREGLRQLDPLATFGLERKALDA